MSRVFVSSTVKDLADHRQTVTNALSRMRRQFTAMEFFGSRGDEPGPVCRDEIERCEYFLGIYAWRYGWIPPGGVTSIIEQEFDHARLHGLTCLCYLIAEDHPWPPTLVEGGEGGTKLQEFKKKVSQLVRSTFTTPDNLGMQIAADLARELAPPRDERSVGGLLQLNWNTFAPDLQQVILDAFKRAKGGSRDGVLATRHLIAAMAAVPNSSGALMHAMPKEAMPNDEPSARMDSTEALTEMFQHDQPFSQCVFGSLQRLLPTHSPSQRLLAIELAADILKNGHGNSVAKFRQAGIDGAAVIKMTRHAEEVGGNTTLIRQALESLPDHEVPLVSYAVGFAPLSIGAQDAARENLVKQAEREGKLPILAGELMRRNPGLLQAST